MAKVVLGIGNPGEEFAETRHNVGWKVVDALSEKMGEKFRKAGFEFWATDGRLGRHRAVLVKPWTYVNGTGRVIPEIQKRYGEEFIVVCDDVNLPLGHPRLRSQGSSGGHNGLQSIIDALGHDGFARLRIGVETARAAFPPSPPMAATWRSAAMPPTSFAMTPTWCGMSSFAID